MNFPTLKTGAVAQYGSDKTARFATTVYRFMDGSEQRFAQMRALRRWVIRLSLLDESELSAIGELFGEETFSFTDPFDGTSCTARFDSNELDLSFADLGQAMITISEVRA